MVENKQQEKKIFLTGVAGFVGSFLAKKLLDNNHKVIAIDNMNDYYDVNLKYERLKMIENYPKFKFINMNIEESEKVKGLFELYRPEIVINLAAQAGVRYSITNPDVYIDSNIKGFYNILESCRAFPVEHLIYASSSSVYGNNQKVPFEETDIVESPASLYAVSKKTNELMASAYSHLYNIPATGLRFFTVYGPMGRPDMAYFKFADKFFNNEPIHIYNNGDFENDLYRDFTYIDDIVEGIVNLIPISPVANSGKPAHEVFNIGNNRPIKLMEFIEVLEQAFSKSLNKQVEFDKIFEPMKPGDVPATYASTEKLYNITGFKPTTSVEEGLQQFTNWYVKYYNHI